MRDTISTIDGILSVRAHCTDHHFSNTICSVIEGIGAVAEADGTQVQIQAVVHALTAFVFSNRGRVQFSLRFKLADSDVEMSTSVGDQTVSVFGEHYPSLGSLEQAVWKRMKQDLRDDD